MKFLAVIIIAIAFLASGCLKNNDTPACTPLTITAPSNEVAALKTYLDTNHINVQQDSRGFFYKIDSSASTAAGHPTACSDVSVTYTGKFLNGQVFDQSGENTPVSFNLSGVIAGWQEAIPLMKTNSTMVLYLPPSLAYGASGYQTIPGNSYLMFTVKLLAFN